MLSHRTDPVPVLPFRDVLFGVFDGHGPHGQQAAQYVKVCLSTEVSSKLASTLHNIYDNLSMPAPEDTLALVMYRDVRKK